MINRNLVIILYIILFCSCRKINNCDEKEKFTIIQSDNNDSSLRLDGYFYLPTSMPMFFYKNGIIIHRSINYSSMSEMVAIENKIKSGEFYQDIKDDRTVWSLYTINVNEIKYEYFTRKGALDCYYPVTVIGKILNDTTIEWTHIVNSDGSEPQSVNGLSHFKQFSHKPDSTNSFIP